MQEELMSKFSQAITSEAQEMERERVEMLEFSEEVVSSIMRQCKKIETSDLHIFKY